MKNSADADASNLEAEYIRMKVTLYKNLFKYCSIIVLILFTKEVVRAIWYGKVASLIMILVTFTFGSLFAYFIRKHKNLELFITISLALFWIFSLMTQYYSNSGYFENPLQVWNLSYVYSAFERIVLSRIAKLSHRICFLIATTTVRACAIRPPEFGLFLMQFVYMSFTIYLDIDKEKYDKKFFATYFKNKEQLLKFKNLVVQDIPESIVIISQDLTRPLFVNNSFEQLIEDNTNKPIHARLKEFILQDSLDVSQESSSQSSSSASLPARRQNLLRFLESTVLQINRSIETQKFSCNLTYKKISQNNQMEGEYTQNYMFEAKVVHLLWDEEPAIAVILHDITQQHTILSLKIADAHKDTILATVSHELRTPLNGIMGMIQIIQKRVKDAEILNYLNICKNSGDLLLSLVNSILDINQIRAKKLKLSIEKVKLSELLENIIRLFQFQCEHKGLELKLRIASNCSQHIITDKNRLSQIFINLLGNALKFTQKGSITIFAYETYNPEEVAFSVEDTGSGIKDEDQRKLFKMFGKLEQSDNSVNPHGVGLGLTISDTLARLLGNDGIQLESEFGKGSKFTFAVKKHLKNTAESLELDSDLHKMVMDERGDVQNKMRNYSREYVKTSQHLQLTEQYSRTIPSIEFSHSSLPNYLRQDSLSFSIGAPHSLQHVPSNTRRHNKSNVSSYVLIVDDNPLNVIIAESLINSHGHKAKTALSGQLAIDIILGANYAAEPIKLIFMDCQMPVMDGFMATKILRKMMAEKKIPEIPIVALTANDSDADREVSKKVGMCEHMTKPLNEGELIRILDKYM